MYMYTINLRKNCFSLVKYFFTCLFTYSFCLLALFFCNNFYFLSSFLACFNKYQYFTYLLLVCYVLYKTVILLLECLAL